MKARLAAIAAFLAGLVTMPVFAGEPKNWALGLQEPASTTAVEIAWFHDFLTIVITVITLFVTGLLIYVMWRFSEKRNPTPSTTTHNSLLEIAWTGIPILILLVIAIPSFKLLYFADRVEDPDMTLKVIGHQWYWSYEYPDHGNFTFDANLAAKEDLKDKSKYLLETDNHVVLPVGKKIQLLMTADDVLHNWGVASLGIKLDTVPGRLNETWVEIIKPGMYYGFCSELCGVNHAYMPIAIRAVTEDEFNEWVKKAQKEFASADGTPKKVNTAKTAQPAEIKVAQTQSAE